MEGSGYKPQALKTQTRGLRLIVQASEFPQCLGWGQVSAFMLKLSAFLCPVVSQFSAVAREPS